MNARERISQRIASELGILQGMLEAETSLRDSLVELGQPEGFKTAKMRYFEDQIDRLRRMQKAGKEA